MNVVFVEPFFPSTQRHFARALAEAGATVIGVGESPPDALDEQLKDWLHDYAQVPSVTDVEAVTRHCAGPGGLHHTGHISPDGVAVPGQAVDEAGLARGGRTHSRLDRGWKRC
jgi:hypothetical protein